MTKSTNTNRADVYTRVTASIITALEKGVRPWAKPWSAANTDGQIVRPLRHNGTPYRGINVLTLWGDATDKGFTSPYWLTFKQALEMEAHVRKGEHGSLVVYADSFKKTEQNEKGEDVEQDIPFLKAYTVFNADQIEGLPETFRVKPEAPKPLADRIAVAEAFVAATGAAIGHGGNRAFYAPGPDRIQLPPFEAFSNVQAYYGTALHELTHWTMHESRLNRDLGRKHWGDPGYAREELVAELGAAFLCADLGIALEPREDHAAYLESWLTVLKGDKRAIFEAAAHAQKAGDFLHGFQIAEGWAA